MAMMRLALTLSLVIHDATAFFTPIIRTKPNHLQMASLADEGQEVVINKYSRTLTAPKSQGASQAMLYATGLKEEDMAKPQVGICSVWYEGNPCNMHLLDLSEIVKKGVQACDCVGYRFNTVGVSDGISM